MPPSRVLSDKLPNNKPVVIFINLDEGLKRAGDTVIIKRLYQELRREQFIRRKCYGNARDTMTLCWTSILPVSMEE